MFRDKRQFTYNRALLICNIALAGFIAAPPAFADDDNRRKPVAVEESPREPVQIRGFDQGEPARVVFFEEVPDGKRLVMQHVSFKSIALDLGETVACRLRVVTGNLDPALEVELDLNVAKQPGSESFIAEGAITLYAEAGDRVLGICSGFDIDNNRITTQTGGSLVGYLVKVKRHRRDDD